MASPRGLQPGILRHVNWQNLGDSLDNSLAPVFGRKRTRSELTYTVEMSDDLISWTPQTPNPGSPGSVVRIPLDPRAGGKSFARLRVRDEGL